MDTSFNTSLFNSRSINLVNLFPQGLHFEVIPSTFEENLDKSTFTPEDYVKETARRKTLEVAARLKGVCFISGVLLTCGPHFL